MDMSSRDINTIPTTDRHIVGYTILVEWSDNPKSVPLTEDMPYEVANANAEWFAEIEEEENAS
jgi:hypothetical protein|tara:strand:- start:24 stop:212 length:189 start_codon:yes stop_codon:yes gene_type:complete